MRGYDPVDFLGEGASLVPCAEPGLDVADGHTGIKSREGRRHDGRRVSLREDHVRPFLREDFFHPEQDPGGDVFQRLPLLHDVEIVMRPDLEYCQNLVEHLPVLRRHAHPGLEIPGMLQEFMNDGGQFDRFGPCPKNHEYLSSCVH